MEYETRRFTFGDAPADLSHVVMTGWARRLTSRADFTVLVGPRIGGGRLAPEAALSIKQRTDRGDVSVEYARSQGVSIGETGTVGYQRLALTMAARPGRGFELRVMNGLVKNESPAAGLDALVYAIDVGVSQSLGAWLTVSGTFHGTVQGGTVAFVDQRIPHSVVMLRFVVAHQRCIECASNQH